MVSRGKTCVIICSNTLLWLSFYLQFLMVLLSGS